MRSCLILPADAEQALAPALGCGAAALLLRLGPPVENEARRRARERARLVITEARCRPAAPRIFVQVAPARSAVVEADLDALAGALPGGVFLEACAGRADLQQLSVKLAVREAAGGVAEGSMSIIALAAQTPAAIFQLGTYAGASPRLTALAYDEASLLDAMSGAIAEGAAPLSAARALLVFAAAAAGVPALDCAPKDGAKLETACAAARRDGFSGMLAQAPDQIGVIKAAFDAA